MEACTREMEDLNVDETCLPKTESACFGAPATQRQTLQATTTSATPELPPKAHRTTKVR